MANLLFCRSLQSRCPPLRVGTGAMGHCAWCTRIRTASCQAAQLSNWGKHFAFTSLLMRCLTVGEGKRGESSSSSSFMSYSNWVWFRGNFHVRPAPQNSCHLLPSKLFIQAEPEIVLADIFICWLDDHAKCRVGDRQGSPGNENTY